MWQRWNSKKDPADPVIVFCCDKTEPGAFNMPLFRMFADPFNTAGLVIDPSLHGGFDFEDFDVMEHKKVIMSCPDEMYDSLHFSVPQPLCYKTYLPEKVIMKLQLQ